MKLKHIIIIGYLWITSVQAQIISSEQLNHEAGLYGLKSEIIRNLPTYQKIQALSRAAKKAEKALARMDNLGTSWPGRLAIDLYEEILSLDAHNPNVLQRLKWYEKHYQNHNRYSKRIRNILMNCCNQSSQALTIGGCLVKTLRFQVNDANGYFTDPYVLSRLDKIAIETPEIETISSKENGLLEIIININGVRTRYIIDSRPISSELEHPLTINISNRRKKISLSVVNTYEDNEAVCTYKSQPGSRITSVNPDGIKKFADVADFLSHEIITLANNASCNNKSNARRFKLQLVDKHGRVYRIPEEVVISLQTLETDNTVTFQESAVIIDDGRLVEITLNNSDNQLAYYVKSWSEELKQQNKIERYPLSIKYNQICAAFNDQPIDKVTVDISNLLQEPKITLRFEEKYLQTFLEEQEISSLTVQTHWMSHNEIASKSTKKRIFDLASSQNHALEIKGDEKILPGRYQVSFNFTPLLTTTMEWWPNIYSVNNLPPPALGLMGREKDYGRFEGNSAFVITELVRRHFFQEKITQQSIGWESNSDGQISTINLTYANAILAYYSSTRHLPYLPLEEGNIGKVSVLIKAFAIFLQKYELFNDNKGKKLTQYTNMINVLLRKQTFDVLPEAYKSDAMTLQAFCTIEQLRKRFNKIKIKTWEELETLCESF